MTCVAFNHDPNNVLGRSEAESSGCNKPRGTSFTNIMDLKTTIGANVYQFVKRGDVSGCTFAFVVQECEWSEAQQADGRTVLTRTITKLKSSSMWAGHLSRLRADIGVRVTCRQLDKTNLRNASVLRAHEEADPVAYFCRAIAEIQILERCAASGLIPPDRIEHELLQYGRKFGLLVQGIERE